MADLFPKDGEMKDLSEIEDPVNKDSSNTFFWHLHNDSCWFYSLFFSFFCFISLLTGINFAKLNKGRC